MDELSAVLVAGGRATRMGRLAEARPKALLRFGASSLLAHHLQVLHSHGIRRVSILAGHLSEMIQGELPGATPTGMSVQLIVEPEPSGSGGCLRHLPAQHEPLLVLFADVMACMDYTSLIERHRSAGALITAVVHPNDHPADSDLVDTNASGWVTALRRKPRPPTTSCRNLAVAGVFVMEPEVLHGLCSKGHLDLVHDLLGSAVDEGCRVLAYKTTEYLKDCGTPERYARVCADFEMGRVGAFHRNVPRPALFMDRDGTVNRHVGYITEGEQLELLPGTAAAIRRLNEAGVLAVLITNQPVIARGECSTDGLERIHARLETLLGLQGAFLDGIYYCPHHPHGGFPGEIVDLKVMCGCRKPEPGLILRAARELPVDLRRSAVVGDSDRDAALAHRLGLPAFIISHSTPSAPAAIVVRDLADSVEQWLRVLEMPTVSTKV